MVGGGGVDACWGGGGGGAGIELGLRVRDDSRTIKYIANSFQYSTMSCQ